MYRRKNFHEVHGSRTSVRGGTDSAVAVYDHPGIAGLFAHLPPTAYTLVHQEGFPAYRVGRSIRIDRKELEAWMRRRAASTIT